ncbi:MAG: alpha-2-macroglobulin, partial [Chloroflexi bacterium]|nr:alpha-2-macroglobulin [Chloroflexota bacterium]
QPEDKEVESRPVRTGADARAEFAFTPAAGGFYRIFASGRDGAGNEFHSAGGVYVTGPGYVPWRVSNDERIELVTDKKQYQPGDVAHVLVPAPFADATGLVTIERQGVLSKEVRPFAGNSVVLDIPIARAYLPNVFVTVSLLKPSTNDNPTPEFRYGQIELNVSAEEQRLNVKLTADKEKVQPRETVTFTVETTDTTGKGVPAELSLALVDEAILSLTDDQPADAFRSLYGFKRLGVQTSAAHTVSLDRVADRARATAAEGGKGGGGGGGEDESRTDFRFTAHWEPALKTDANGRGTLTVRMPDTLTTWRLTGRGITKDSRAGMAETKVVSSKPLIVRPVTPRFLTAGDRPEMGAIVYNFTDAAVDVSVSLGGEGIAVEGDAAKLVKVQPGDKQVVSWKTAPVPAGSAKVRWSAGGGGLQDAVELTLPVQALAT